MKVCNALKTTRVFSHYDYGDPLPAYARYFSSDGVPTTMGKAATTYVRCEREAGHDGKHLARFTEPWDYPTEEEETE